MPVWGALLGTLGYNIVRHLRGKSTLCSTARKHVPIPAIIVGWLGLTGWIIPHIRKKEI